MNKLGLCMIVRDEERNIQPCLGDIAHLFNEIVVVDTGSRDGTPRLIRQICQIEPLTFPIEEETWFNKYEARNFGFERLNTDWILSVDADERIAPDQILTMRAALGESGADGYFTRWTTYAPGRNVADYKLSVFRKGFRSSGLVHENVQQDMRQKKARAVWTDLIHLHHFPDPGKIAYKRDFYQRRLLRAIDIEPSWYRYHWFLGYALFREHKLEAAEHRLQVAASSCSRQFPVECLNAHLILAALYAAQGKREITARTLTSARNFLEKVGDDFEVRINFGLRPWIERASQACSEGRLEDIVAYEFCA